MGHRGFAIPIVLVGILLLLVIGSGGYYLSKSKLLTPPVTPITSGLPTPILVSPVLKPTIPATATPTPQTTAITTTSVSGWKTYTSPSVGISISYPQTDILQPAQLDSVLSIQYSNNKLVNQELKDGYQLSILYDPLNSNTSSLKDRIEIVKNSESELCATSDVSTTKIDQQQTFYFNSTSCTYDTVLYFVRGGTFQYEIRATHNGDISKYREITKKIVESIRFL